ncbi:MAG: hypothetical protein II135_06105, partial [Clostridia bacterium]|nr:hypothetical protein [Clostridia bacterium]
RIFLFHSVRKNRISLAPGFPENELAYFRGFAEANFTRKAYLTAEGDFAAVSAARGGGSPAGDRVTVIYGVATLGGSPAGGGKYAKRSIQRMIQAIDIKT